MINSLVEVKIQLSINDSKNAVIIKNCSDQEIDEIEINITSKTINADDINNLLNWDQSIKYDLTPLIDLTTSENLTKDLSRLMVYVHELLSAIIKDLNILSAETFSEINQPKLI